MTAVELLRALIADGPLTMNTMEERCCFWCGEEEHGPYNRISVSDTFGTHERLIGVLEHTPDCVYLQAVAFLENQ